MLTASDTAVLEQPSVGDVRLSASRSRPRFGKGKRRNRCLSQLRTQRTRSSPHQHKRQTLIHIPSLHQPKGTTTDLSTSTFSCPLSVNNSRCMYSSHQRSYHSEKPLSSFHRVVTDPVRYTSSLSFEFYLLLRCVRLSARLHLSRPFVSRLRCSSTDSG